MKLIQVAVASLLLPIGALAQAADVSRMANNPKAGQMPAQPMAPNVAKTPSPGGPVPVPYPNIGTGQVKEKSPVIPAVRPEPRNTVKTNPGHEPGTIKGVVGTPRSQGGAVMLNPLDSPPPRKANQLSDSDQLDQRRLQEQTQRESRNAQSISTVQKKKQDSDESTIKNLK